MKKIILETVITLSLMFVAYSIGTNHGKRIAYQEMLNLLIDTSAQVCK